jgi:hypothetical protein
MARRSKQGAAEGSASFAWSQHVAQLLETIRLRVGRATVADLRVTDIRDDELLALFDAILTCYAFPENCPDLLDDEGALPVPLSLTSTQQRQAVDWAATQVRAPAGRERSLLSAVDDVVITIAICYRQPASCWMLRGRVSWAPAQPEEYGGGILRDRVEAIQETLLRRDGAEMAMFRDLDPATDLPRTYDPEAIPRIVGRAVERIRRPATRTACSFEQIFETDDRARDEYEKIVQTHQAQSQAQQSTHNLYESRLAFIRLVLAVLRRDPAVEARFHVLRMVDEARVDGRKAMGQQTDRLVDYYPFLFERGLVPAVPDGRGVPITDPTTIRALLQRSREGGDAAATAFTRTASNRVTDALRLAGRELLRAFAATLLQVFRPAAMLHRGPLAEVPCLHHERDFRDLVAAASDGEAAEARIRETLHRRLLGRIRQVAAAGSDRSLRRALAEEVAAVVGHEVKGDYLVLSHALDAVYDLVAAVGAQR